MTVTHFVTLILALVLALVCCCALPTTTASIDHVAMHGTWSRGSVVTLSFQPTEVIHNATLSFTPTNTTTTPQHCGVGQPAFFLAASDAAETGVFALADSTLNPTRFDNPQVGCHVSNGTAAAMKLTAQHCDFVVDIIGTVLPTQTVYCYLVLNTTTATTEAIDYTMSSTTTPTPISLDLPGFVQLIVDVGDNSSNVWDPTVHTFGQDHSTIELDTTTAFPDLFPMKLTLAFVNAKLPSYTTMRLDNLRFIQDSAFAYCGQDVRLFTTEYDVYIVTGQHPATNFTCVGSVKPLSEQEDPDELSTTFVVSLSAPTTGLITRLNIPITHPSTTTTTNRPPRLRYRQLHAPPYESSPKIGAYKEYFVDTLFTSQGRGVTINLNNITGNVESFADLDTLFGINTWSLQAQCGNLPVHNFTSTTPTTIHFTTNQAVVKCRLEFISFATQVIPFQMSFALNGHDVLLPIQPKIKNNDFRFATINNTHAHLALSLSLDIPTTWPINPKTNTTIKGFDYTFPLEFAPNYGWIAEDDHGFKCRVVNVTINNNADNSNGNVVPTPLNNTGGRLVKLNITPLQRIGTHQFSYDLTTSQDLPGGHQINLECVVHVNPAETKLQITKTRMYLTFGDMYNSQDTRTNAPGSGDGDGRAEGWKNVTRLSGDLHRFDLAIPLDKLPPTPAQLGMELAELFNIAQNGTNINLFTPEDILVEPLNATHQNHVNIAGAEFFSHVINFPTEQQQQQQQLAISFTNRNDQHVRVTVRSPSTTTTGVNIDLFNYFKNNAFSHPHYVLQYDPSGDDNDYWSPVTWPWLGVNENTTVHHIRQVGDVCVYNAQCYTGCYQSKCYQKELLVGWGRGAAARLQDVTEEFTQWYEGVQSRATGDDGNSNGDDDDDDNNGGGDDNGGGGDDNGGGGDNSNKAIVDHVLSMMCLGITILATTLLF